MCNGVLYLDMVIEAFRQPAIKQPYVMRSLAMPTYDVTKFTKSDELVNRSFWWEVLCVVRARPPYIVDKTIEVLDDPALKVSPSDSCSDVTSTHTASYM